jgi:hypothetical protein
LRILQSSSIVAEAQVESAQTPVPEAHFPPFSVTTFAQFYGAVIVKFEQSFPDLQAPVW